MKSKLLKFENSFKPRIFHNQKKMNRNNILLYLKTFGELKERLLHIIKNGISLKKV